MIIWGSRAKESVVGPTEFFCPRCRTEVPGEHVRVSSYFTLYFIPLFPTSTLGEYVRCDECQGEFNMSVLDLSREQVEAGSTPWKCAHCGNGNPSDYKECLSCREPRTDANIFLE